MQDKKRKT